MDKLVPVLSLLVAGLAVFVGPLISLRIARRQVKSSLEVANKQIIVPMRQAWVNSLRDLLAELAGTAHYHFEGRHVSLQEGPEVRVPVSEDLRTDDESQRLSLLEHKVQLMLNPKEEDHRKLEQLIRTMIVRLDGDKEGTKMEYVGREFVDAHSRVMELSREVLKREWDRVRAPIEL